MCAQALNSLGQNSLISRSALEIKSPFYDVDYESKEIFSSIL